MVMDLSVKYTLHSADIATSKLFEEPFSLISWHPVATCGSEQDGNRVLLSGGGSPEHKLNFVAFRR